MPNAPVISPEMDAAGGTAITTMLGGKPSATAAELAHAAFLAMWAEATSVNVGGGPAPIEP